jgi:hypothetical protein
VERFHAAILAVRRWAKHRRTSGLNIAAGDSLIVFLAR